MSSANIGFEETLWKSADKLRGSMDSAEYKYVVLGLIFMKYISDKFETKYEELVEEGDGFEEDRESVHELFFGAKIESKHGFVPLVGIFER